MILKTILFFVGFLLLYRNCKCEVLSGEFTISPSSWVKTIRVSPIGNECEVKFSGVFQLPVFDPEKFQIQSYCLEWHPIAAGAAWDADNDLHFVRNTIDGRFSDGNGPSTSLNKIAHGNGNSRVYLISDSHFMPKFDDFPDGYFMSSGNIPKIFNFSVEAQAVSGSYDSRDWNGSFAFIHWGTMKVKYQVIRIDPLAALPSQGDSLGDYQLYRQSVDGELDRPPPFLTEMLRPFTDEPFQIKSSTVFSGPKTFTTSVFGHTGYRYRLFVGSRPFQGSPVHEIDGNNQLLAFDHTFQGSADRGFAWIEETKIDSETSPMRELPAP